MRISFIALLLLIAVSATAQQTGGTRGQRPDGGKGMPKPGKIFGSIRDAETNQPVSFASVAVLMVRDSSLVGGVQTNEKGNFIVDEVPMGKVILKVSFIGYTAAFSEVITINPQSLEVDAGMIKLKSSSTSLKTVTVTGEKSEMINSIDRKIYNLDKNIVNTGGTVTEVLQNIPSVTVDIDGKVSLRGNENVTILIDGKPSGVLGGDRRAVLQQIPAGAVEQIEVITNPSAKYDASGMSGIINIKTKKEKMKGMNGNISVGAGTNDKYNLSIGGNNRTPRTNIYFNYVFRHESRSITGENTQYNFFPSQLPYYYHTSMAGTNKSDVHTGKIGSDFISTSLIHLV
ncbi:MAG: TonB-dependent receptor [Bacteroidetes bacterium]|nr:TonB-dependent receptor [Bacteroidota bacterium]